MIDTISQYENKNGFMYRTYHSKEGINTRINPNYVQQDLTYHFTNNIEFLKNKTADFARVALRGSSFIVKNGVLTLDLKSGFWSAPIFKGDSFEIKLDNYNMIYGKVSHVITKDDGAIIHICLIFEGNLQFEGDLSNAEFLIH